MNIHSPADCADKPLIEVEEKTDMQRVFAASELELKAKYPAAWAIRRERAGQWSGIIFND